MTTQLATLSLIVAGAFFAVLCGFLVHIGNVLAAVAARLSNVRGAATRMRGDCALISPSVDAMNQNLYEVAAQLAEVGDASEQLAQAAEH